MRYWWGLILVCIGLKGFGQAWQQQVDYSIQCRLNDQSHRLDATMQIKYINHSPHELFSLMLHTWMNTFITSPTPYSKQLIELGIDRRYVLKPHEQGGYTQLKFFYKGEELRYRFTDDTKEILELSLIESCKPGQSLIIEVSFSLSIPKNISRGGHLGQAYHLAQWYPKLALYDTSGWHSMHYLELGEYYNEFGDYEVTIDLPSNYLVASTGTLEDMEEKKYLLQYADSCKRNASKVIAVKNESRPSSLDFKKVKFKARQVIDFAWFADKQFLVNHQALLAENKTIDLWAFYYNENRAIWSRATQYISNALNYFNELVGPYPYPQMTAVECLRIGSDAMEYPMITLIDKYYGQPLELEKVIVHEVGHNWFQAILATDERIKAWMDEGVVTYYENRFFRDSPAGGIFSDTPVPLHTDYDQVPDFDWYVQANRNQDKPSLGNLDHYSIREYIQSVYEKPAKGLKLLEKDLGKDRFDQCMRQYYSQWKFRHPQPSDLFALFKSYGADWFEDLYISNAFKVDCTIEQLGSTSYFLINHNAKLTIPIELAGYRKNNKTFSKMVRIPPEGDTIGLTTDSLDYIILDPDFCLPEINRTNNIYRIRSSPFTPKKFALRFLGGIDHSLTKEIYLSPALAYNFYDGLIAGLAMHNLTLPSKPFRYAGVLGYGLRAKNPVWIGGMDYTLSLRSPKLDNLNFSLESRHFTFNRDTHYLSDDHYFKLAPSIKLNFIPAKHPSARQYVAYRWIYIKQWYSEGINFENRTYRNKTRSYFIHEFSYRRADKRSLFPFEFSVTGELSKSYSKLYTQYTLAVPYAAAAKKQGELYIFGGIQSIQAENKVFSSFLLNGLPGIGYYQRDYKMDELLFGRSEITGSHSQQVFLKDAGFKNLSQVGSSTSWMLAAGFRTSLPGFIPLKPYIQTALIPGRASQSFQFLYSTGVSVILLPKIMELNFPIWESKQITTSYSPQQKKSYLKKCSFVFNMKSLNPFKWLDQVSN